MENLLDRGERQSQGVQLDFKRVLARAIRFWYLIVISLGIALTTAFYRTRYSQHVYTVTSSVVIRETRGSSESELLYNNALINPYRNYLNEPYILRSYPLIERVVNMLNFNTSFYREGYFLTTEAYAYVPVRAEWCHPEEIKSGRFIFTLVDSDHYTLRDYSNATITKDLKAFSLNDSIDFDGYKICIKNLPNRNLKAYVGVPFILVIQSTRSVASSYIGRLNVSWAEEGSGVLNLSITGTNPDKEVDFLNGLVRAYQQLDLDKKNEAAERTITFIKDQLKAIRDSLGTVEYQLQSFGTNSRREDISEEARRLLEKLETFDVQKAELLIREQYFKYLEIYLGKSKNIDQVVLPASVGIKDEVLDGLLNKMIEVQLEIRLYADEERAKNPLVVSKLERLHEVKSDILEALNTVRATDKIKMEFLNSKLTGIQKRLDQLPASERNLISVQRNYSLLENLYIFLMQKLSEAGISKAANTSDVEPVNPPIIGGAISPKPMQNYSIAALLGLAIPLGIFVLFELLNIKVQSKEDIDKMTAIPFIGGIGHNSSIHNLIVKERPKSGVAESFRALRSNLNYFTADKTRQVFMVSSSISGEGKTFTTINLATVFALSGKRTLIVGADMRRPKIFEDFDRLNNVGLSTFLSGISGFDQIVQNTEIENLFLVSGGPVPPNPSELLMTDRFEIFVKSALDQFDYVIIDTPPLALVTDAFVISKYVNHTVFVLRQNYSPKEFLRSIDEYYRSGKLKNISILLNDIYKSGLGYGYGQGYAYHYGYSYGYGYGRHTKGNGYYED